MLQNMRKLGNDRANEIWNAQRKKPPIPFDIDEVDSAMERFTRQKYEKKMFVAGAEHKTVSHQQYVRPESPISLFGTPPPPPPKPARKFGFGPRSSSSGSFLRRGTNKEEKQKRPANITTVLTLGKKSKIVGATIGLSETREGLEMELVRLAELGYIDMPPNGKFDWENEADLARTVKMLEKSGYKYGSGKQVQVQVQARKTPTSEVSQPTGASIIQPPPVQERQTLSRTLRKTRSNNPFESQSATSVFDAAMENMTISSTAIPSAQSHNQGNHPTTTPTYTQPQAYFQQPQQYINNPYTHPTNNPFMAAQQMSPPQSATSSYMSGVSSNPFFQQPTTQNQTFSPPVSTFPLQQNTYSPQYLQSPQTAGFSPYPQQEFTNPYYIPQSPATYYNPYQQQMTPQVSGKLDKNSIMALYNYPGLAPCTQFSLSPQDTATSSTGSQLQESISPNMLPPPRRSVTMPLVGSKNPFLAAGNAGF